MAVLYHARYTPGNLKLHSRSVREMEGYRRARTIAICPQDIAQGHELGDPLSLVACDVQSCRGRYHQTG